MPVPNPEWRVPVRLATSGTLARLWNSKGQERGNGIAISLLPILALHVRPKDGKTWTRWRRIPYQDFAELAGISPNSVRRTITRLQVAGLLQKKTWWREGGSLTYVGSTKAKRIVLYRLNAKEVYPQQDEPSRTLPASFFESGTWARLTPAARALYLVQWCLRAGRVGRSDEQFGTWLPGKLSRSVEFTDYVWSPRDGELHLTLEELPKGDDIRIRGSRYLHAIYDPSKELVIHLDGAVRVYDPEQWRRRASAHVRNSGKAGIRIKTFRLDREVEVEDLTSLTACYFVWNNDVARFCGLPVPDGL